MKSFEQIAKAIYQKWQGALLATGGQSAETTEDAINEVTVLPDGSAFAVYSYPLPKDHWLYASREYEQGAEEPKELAAPILTHAAREQVVSAIRYAVRAATDCGKETNFDPDALVQNAVYALCGPFNKNQPQPQADARDAELVAAVVYASTEAMNSGMESPSFDGSIILESHHAASLSLALDELQQHRAAKAAKEI